MVAMKKTPHYRLSKSESLFVQGPLSRFKELVFMFKVLYTFIRAFQKMYSIGPCVTIFGSARFGPEMDHYKDAERIGAAIAKLGFTVMTGGGPGIMEAANKGAYEAGGYSVAILCFPWSKNRIRIFTNGFIFPIFLFEK